MHARKTEAQLQAALEEAVSLCDAIALDVAYAETIKLRHITPATYIGKGKLEELAAHIEAESITLFVFNGVLSPLQQRNLEKALGCKVIDRTALILEIFGARARTAEGKLQVELASLTYQKSRLVRSWTHLERQRGGFGFMGGPGESQIEIDRRLIAERIDKIKLALQKTVRTRALHRKERKAVPYPIVALVGYTNAGKSTLFNRLTGSAVMAKDMLFATLDPTLRALTLPSGRKIVLADTVGFIADLPTELVAAFRATLEEVLQADLLLHVRDASNAENAAQKKEVMAILNSLYGKNGVNVPIIEVMNKTDLLPEGAAPLDEDTTAHMVAISAHTGAHCDMLLGKVETLLAEAEQAQHYSIRFPASEGKLHAWLYANATPQNLILEDSGDYTAYVRLSANQLRQLGALSSRISILPQS